MDAAFFALGHSKPTLKVGDLRVFDVGAAMKFELAEYYGADEDSFETIEASWNGDGEYAEVVTLNGRIVGALDRPLMQEDVAAIWGVDRMEKRAFVNRIRSLFNIERDVLPELTHQQQLDFVRNPVRFLLESDELQSDAIMREIERRQPAAERIVSRKPATPAAAKVARSKKAKRKVEGQTEMLLPIPGGKQTVAAGPASAATTGKRKTG